MSAQTVQSEAPIPRRSKAPLVHERLLEWGRTSLLCCVALTLMSCRDPVPEMGRDVPRSFGPSLEFQKKLEQLFPVGSDEAILRKELRRQGFSDVTQTDHSRDRALAPDLQYFSRYEVDEFGVCNHNWAIGWSAVNGRITVIQGTYRTICL